MSKRKPLIMTPRATQESMKMRLGLVEFDTIDNSKRVCALEKRMEDVEDYVREMDNKVDAIGLILQELLNELKRTSGIEVVGEVP